MAHGTRIGGTAYGITGGKCIVDGTEYSVQKGRTLVGGTGYSISLASKTAISIDGYGYYSGDPGRKVVAKVSINSINEISTPGNYEFNAGETVIIKATILNVQASKTGYIKVNGDTVATVTRHPFGETNTAEYSIDVSGKIVQIKLEGAFFSGGYYGNIDITTE